MIKRKPYLLLFVVIVTLMIGYFLTDAKATTILNCHDIYFVTLKRTIFLFFILLFGICSLIYLILDMLKVQLWKKSIWIHIIGIILSTGLFFLIDYLSEIYEYRQKTVEDLISPPNYQLYFGVSILISISLQLFFLINIFASIIKKLRTSDSQ